MAKNKYSNSGTDGAGGYEFQLHGALYVLLEQYNDIKDTKLLTIEGEMDDISGLGQTHAANYLCTNIPQNKKEAITFEGVGHYGIFAGKKWRNEIYSKIKNFIEN